MSYVFLSTGGSLSSIFFLGSSYAGCNELLVVILFTATVCSRGLITSAIYINSVDLSPNYVGPLSAVVNGISSATGVIGPYIVGLLTTNVRTLFYLALRRLLYLMKFLL